MRLKRIACALLLLAAVAALWFSSLKPEVKQMIVGGLSGPAESVNR